MAATVETVEATAAVQKNAGIRVLVALCAASFLAALNFFAVGPFYSDIARDLDTTVPLVGQVATLMIVVSALAGLLVGPLADRYGYRLPLTIGMVGIALNLVGTGLAPSFPFLIGLGVVGGAADAVAFGLPLAIAGTRYTGHTRKRAISWALVSLASAPIFGTPVLTAIGSATDWRTALLVAGGFAAVGALFVALALPPDGKRPQTRWQWSELREAYTPLLHDRPTVRLLGFGALRAASWIGLLAYLGAFLSDRIGLGTGKSGLIYTATGIALATGNFIGGRIHPSNPRRASGVAMLFAAVGGVGAFTSTDLRIVVPMLLLLAFSSAIAGVTMTSLLAAESPAGLGTTMVFNGSVFNAGCAVGTLLGGVLIAISGYPALGVGLSLFAVLGALMIWRPDPTPAAS